MFCTKCGRENADGVPFCGACGAAMVMPEQEATPPSPVQPEPVQPVFTPYPEPAKTSGLAIGALICGVLAFCTGGLSGIIGVVLAILAIREAGASGGRVSSTLPIISLVVSGAGACMIVILAAILFPVFSKARDKARDIACTNNSKQISMAIMQYAQDNDEAFPMKQNWCDDVQIYGRNQQIFVCPLAPHIKSAYAYNAKIDRLLLSKAAYPGRIPAQFEATGGWNQYGGPEIAEDRHGMGVIIGFMDGHVQSYPMATLNDTSYMYWDPKDAAKSNEDDKANSNGTN